MSRNVHRLPELALAMILPWIGTTTVAWAQQAQSITDGRSQVDSREQSPVSEPLHGGPLTRVDIEALRAKGRAKGWTFTVGHNSATDRSLDELCGLIIPPDWKPPKVRGIPAARRDELPTFFDWRILRGTTPMRDQGACGSCWAFSAVGPVESAILIKEGVEEDLSEQWLMSCTDAGGCGGGWHLSALEEYLCSAQGAVVEEDFPYEAADVPCGGPYGHPYCIDNLYYVGDEYLSDVPLLKQAILDYGPISVCIGADPAFQAYMGGVFNADYTEGINHCVALVGWDDNQGANGVWYMRNSWGPDWGEYGYMRIEYGCSSVGYVSLAVDYNPSDCNHNSVPDSQDFANCSGEAWCDDCNSNGLLDTCERDCNGNGVPDDCDITSEYSPDVNANFLPDECETDCNGNEVFDFYELQDDLDADIDRNLIPDECQDCDGDEIWDWDDLGRPHGLLVVSTGSNLVRSFYPEVGAAAGSHGVGHLSDPYDVVVGPDRHLYVSSSGDNRVVELDTLGNYVGDLNPCGTYPTGLAFGPDGNLYIASRDTNSVFRYDTTANTCLGECVSPGTGGLDAPYGLTFDSQGHMFVSSSGNNQVIQYDLAWQFVRSYTDAALLNPRGLAFHPSGDLLIASYDTTRVLRFNTQTGGYLGVFTTMGAGPGAVQGLAYGPNGYLYVVTYGGGVVRIYEVNGETGVSWRTFNRADPDLNHPAGLAFYPASPNDCNDNGVQDDCDIDPTDPDGDGEVSPDINGNGIPDECEFVPIDPPTTPDGEAGFEKNRYISFVPGNPGEQIALRVNLTDLPDEFATYEGTHVWVGEPVEICENSGQAEPPPEGCGPAWVPGGPALTMWSANLQATQYCHDFGSVGLLHVTDCEIVPGATYTVQAIPCGVDSGVEGNYSDPLVIGTGSRGNICGPWDVDHWSAPDTSVDVTVDVTACLEKFKNSFGAPIKARANVDPNVPGWKVNISTDVTQILDAFKSQPYPFTGPGTCSP